MNPAKIGVVAEEEGPIAAGYVPTAQEAQDSQTNRGEDLIRPLPLTKKSIGSLPTWAAVAFAQK